MNVKSDIDLEKEYLLLVENISKSTAVDILETKDQQRKRRKRLEAPGNQEAWIKYYFPKYSFAAPAIFQTASTQRILDALDEMNKKGFGRMYQSRIWGRGLSKSTRRMMEVFYLAYVRKFPINELLCSKTETNAMLLLAPYMANFETNHLLINDYQKEKNTGDWTMKKFTTLSGWTFRAVGAEQNPRGSKKEELRINLIDADDLDDDEVCRNPDRLDIQWQWFEKSVIPTVEISRPYFIFFDNNLIYEDSLALRASKMASDKEMIGIMDDQGKSTWPEKTTQEMIAQMQQDMSIESFEGEYMNNPMASGHTFPEQKFDKCPPLNQMQFLVSYTDPSSSNKDKPSLKSGAGNSRKAVILMGRKGNKYYIYKCFLDIMTSAQLIDAMYAIRDYVAGQTILYTYIENNTLQDPIYSQIYLPLIFHKGENHPLGVLGITPDTRAKGDKWMRIESNLEPPNRLGNLIFNIDEINDPHMKRLVAEFKAAKATSKKLDGCDGAEGAKFIIDQKLISNDIGGYSYNPRERSPEKYF